MVLVQLGVGVCDESNVHPRRGWLQASGVELRGGEEQGGAGRT